MEEKVSEKDRSNVVSGANYRPPNDRESIIAQQNFVTWNPKHKDSRNMKALYGDGPFFVSKVDYQKARGQLIGQTVHLLIGTAILPFDGDRVIRDNHQTIPHGYTYAELA